MQKGVTHTKVFRLEKPALLFFNPKAELDVSINIIVIEVNQV